MKILFWAVLIVTWLDFALRVRTLVGALRGPLVWPRSEIVELLYMLAYSLAVIVLLIWAHTTGVFRP